MKRLLWIFAVILITLPLIGYACGEREIRIGGWSQHMVERNGDLEWNENHHGFGIDCDQWGILHFENSFNKDSTALHYETDRRRLNGFMEFNWFMGISTGYSGINDTGVQPFITPNITVNVAPHVNVEVWLNPVVSVATLKLRF